MKRTLLSCLAACGSTAMPAAPPKPVAVAVVVAAPPSPAIPFDPAIVHGTLPNGLAYYIEKLDASEDKPVQLELDVDAGSVDEAPEELGAAYVISRLADRGTKRFDATALEGVSGSAGYDMTHYDQYLTPGEVPHALDLLRDCAADIAFADFDALRAAAAAPLDSYARFAEVQLRGSPYADRTWRSRPEIANLTREHALAFYRAWYQPQHMALVVTGPIEPAEIERAIAAKFGDLVNGGTVRQVPAVPAEATLRAAVAEERVPFTVELHRRVPHRPLRTEADLRARLVQELIGTMYRDRMERLKSEPNAPIHFGGGGVVDLVRTTDLVTRSVLPKPGKVSEALDLLASELGRIEQHGYTGSELRRAKRRAALETDLDRRSTSAERWRLYRLTRNGDTPPPLAWEIEATNRLVTSISLSEINAIAMAPGPGTVLVGSDQWHPPAEEVLARFQAARAKPQTPWDDTMDEPWVHPRPTGGTTIKTEHDDAFDATIWTLSNGIRVIAKRLCCNITGQADVKITGWRPVGGASAPDARFAIDAATGLGFPWTEPPWAPLCCAYNYAHVVERMRVSLEAEIPHDKLEIMFQKIYADNMGVPKRDASAFAAWQQERRADLVFQVNLDEYAMELAGAQLGHEPAITPAMVDALDLDRVLAARKALFEDFTGETFAIVGRFDLAVGKELAEVYLGGLPTGHPLPSPRRTLPVQRGVATAAFPPPTDFYCFQWLASSLPATTDDHPVDAHVLELVLDRWLQGSDTHITTHAYLDPITHSRELRFVAGCSHPYGFDARTITRIAKAAHSLLGAAPSEKVLADVRETLSFHNADLYHVNERVVAAYRDGWRNDDLTARITADHVRDLLGRYFDGKNFVTGTVKR